MPNMAALSPLSPDEMGEWIPKFGFVPLFGKVQLFIDKAGLLPVVRGQMQTGTGKSHEPLLGD